jgi:hypothetical protein
MGSGSDEVNAGCQRMFTENIRVGLPELLSKYNLELSDDHSGRLPPFLVIR